MAEAVDGKRDQLHWAVRLVLQVSEPLLNSDEIRQALDQIDASADTLRRLVSDHADEFLCSPAMPEVGFVEPIDWPRMLARWRASKKIGLVAVIVAVVGGAAASMVLLVSWAALSVLVLAALAPIVAVVRLVPRAPLEPIPVTRDDLRRRVIGPFLREELNRMLAVEQCPVHLRVTSAPGLAELTDREQIVTTDAVVRLGQLSGSMSSGNLGVSGPRGVGKTTLLRNFCDASLLWRDDSRWRPGLIPDLRVMVSAPVDYDAREFTLHLFSRLCETILATGRARATRQPSAWARFPLRRAFLVTAAVAVAAAGLTLIVWALRTHPSRPPKLTALGACLVIGGILLAAGTGLFIVARGSPGLPRADSHRGKPGLVEEARSWLTRLQYLQAFTTGYSGTLRLPAGAKLEATATRQLTELQLTLPEVVNKYREFAARAALWWRSGTRTWFHPQEPLETEGRILIGIDEVDKIHNTKSAERFLNDIKAIFGIPHCIYLVSVSDDALRAFERRTFAARTAFDSSFDEVITVSYLDFDAAKNLPRRRVAGLPDSAIAVCRVISGGLPRDLIRAARTIIEACAGGHTHITDLAQVMIAREVEILKRSCLAALAQDESRLTQSGLVPHLLDETWPGQSSKAILAAIGDNLRQPSIPKRFTTALYFYATVAEIFGPGLDLTIASLPPSPDAHATRIGCLARARNTLSGNPDVAWELITRFRATRNLNIQPPPWQADTA